MRTMQSPPSAQSAQPAPSAQSVPRGGPSASRGGTRKPPALDGATAAGAAGSAGAAPVPERVTAEDRRVFEAASMYYAQAETMEVIARHLGCSRSTVSRLLARARREGVVRIELSRPGVRAHIVPVREGTTDIHRLQQVAAVAASRFVELVGELAQTAAGGGEPEGAGSGPGLVVGAAWGTTMSEVAAALPARRVPGLTIVQLNGASDPVHEGPSAGQMLSLMGESLGARTIGFPVPAFFDRAATRRAMWQERSIKRVLSVAAAARLAVFGVGTLETGTGALPSQVYAGGHLTRSDLATARREGVVGDVCTVLLRGDGTWSDIDLNARATGPTPVRLAGIPRRLCVVAGTGKAGACFAALRARVATDLIVDDATARAVLSLSQRKETP